MTAGDNRHVHALESLLSALRGQRKGVTAKRKWLPSEKAMALTQIDERIAAIKRRLEAIAVASLHTRTLYAIERQCEDGARSAPTGST